MFPSTRRQFLLSTSSVGLGMSTCSALQSAAATVTKGNVTLSFGTYGMQALKLEEAIRVLGEIGYDGVEVIVRPSSDATPANMSAARRQQVRTQLDAHGLRLTALMENLHPSEDETTHRAGLERLKQAAALGHDLAPATQPLIQTVLGGRKWEQAKPLFLQRLADWVELAEKQDALIAIKPHRGGGMSRPEEAVWLIQQLGQTPRLRMVYDYSHYAFRDMTLAATVATSLKYTAHVAVKDTIQKGAGTTFVLPGESGNLDYDALLTMFYRGGYRGDFCCEVSSAVWKQPGYDPAVAAETCYRNMATAFTRQRIPRPT
ncbi:MAG: hypothetical protein CMJ59_08575 [Planctomycetaceae bacterium]|nr:hypothetical protein [Planctomycetaceae bacterium]